VCYKTGAEKRLDLEGEAYALGKGGAGTHWEKKRGAKINPKRSKIRGLEGGERKQLYVVWERAFQVRNVLKEVARGKKSP